MSYTNKSGTFVHVHAYGEEEDPVTGRTIRTPVGTVAVAPNEEFPDWAEPGEDYDEALTEDLPTAKERVAAGVGVFPFDLDQAVTVAREQEQEDVERSRRREQAEAVQREMTARSKTAASPERSTATTKASGGGR